MSSEDALILSLQGKSEGWRPLCLEVVQLGQAQGQKGAPGARGQGPERTVHAGAGSPQMMRVRSEEEDSELGASVHLISEIWW